MEAGAPRRLTNNPRTPPEQRLAELAPPIYRVFKGAARRVGWLFFSSLESSFAAGVKIFHDNLVGLSFGSDGEGDTAFAHGIFALRLIGECIPVIMSDGKSLVFWTLYDC